MTNPTPRKPNKITITTYPGGFDALVEIEEVNTTVPVDLKEVLDRRKRERREQREREAREQGGNAPPTDTPAA